MIILSFILIFLWAPLDRKQVSLEKSVLEFNLNEDIQFSYKTYNYDDIEPEKERISRNRIKYRWTLDNIPAFVDEPYMPNWSHIIPYIRFSPKEFVYDGYKGNMESWKKFGYWINDLNANRRDLPQETVDQIKELIHDVEDDREKVRLIYNYMQSRTRYVSIQLGLGGLQPSEAAIVDKKGYGDCKDLTNYTQALLDIAGIKSYYALIRSGADEIDVDPEFPYNYFNHAILCVVLEDDTLWLETTSSIVPYGYIGINNSDRYVLLITEQGGKLTKTPGYNIKDNEIKQYANISLSDQGNISANLNKQFSGFAFEERLGITLAGKQRQKDFLLNNIKVNNAEIVDLEYKELFDPLPRIQKHIKLNARNYVSRAGERIFFRPVIFNKNVSVVPSTKERVYDFELDGYLYHNDSIVWSLPSGYKPGYIPEDARLVTPFGSYHLNYDYNQKKGKLIVRRKYYEKTGKFDAEEFVKFALFRRAIYQNDRNKIVLVQD